jgi:hypothetical protein
MTEMNEDNFPKYEAAIGSGLYIRVGWQGTTPVYSLENPSQKSFEDSLEKLSHEQLIKVINLQLSAPRRAGNVFVIGMFLAASMSFLFNVELGMSVLVIATITSLVMLVVESKRRKVSISYELNDQILTRQRAIFKQLSKNTRVWNYDRMQNLQVVSEALPKISCDVQTYTIKGLTPAPFFAPDILYLYDGRSYSGITYDQIEVTGSTYRTAEAGPVPQDAKIVGEQWLYQRKDGNPDRRYKYNPRVPIVEYGLIRLILPGALDYKLGISNYDLAHRIVAAFQDIRQSKQLDNLPTPPKLNAPEPSKGTKGKVDPEMQKASTLNSRFVELSDIQTALQESRGEIIWSRNGSFLDEARKLHARVGEPCEFAPFKAYWPTYANLNKNQTRWYFYWRSELRRGKFLPTDASYLFLHAYEILNLVEKPDPKEAAEYLKQLWRNYRDSVKEISSYFPEWGGDLIAESDCIESALAWWFEMLGETSYGNDILNAIIFHSAKKNKLSALPMNVWRKLTDFRSDSEFFRRYNTDGKVTAVYRRAISIADNYCRVKTGRSLVEQFVSGDPTPLQKKLFASAVIQRNHPESISLGVAYNFLGNVELSVYLASLMRHAENILRKHFGFSLLRSKIELPDDLKYILTMLLQEDMIPEKQNEEESEVDIGHKVQKDRLSAEKLNIDFTLVERIKLESDEVRELLGQLSGNELVEDIINEPVSNQVITGDTKDTVGEESNVWESIYTQLSSAETELFSEIVRSGRLDADAVAAIARKHQIMDSVLIDGLNEHAVEFLGNSLIYIVGDIYEVEEEILEQIKSSVSEMEQK